jgi:hypothetical protein
MGELRLIWESLGFGELALAALVNCWISLAVLLCTKILSLFRFPVSYLNGFQETNFSLFEASMVSM